jgi:NAD(P)-dependent dehydrogenase (short-subunit alcohol dehydrogenase family)
MTDASTMRNKVWTADDIPDMTKKVVIVTGATAGLGKAATQALARKGATVILAVRNPAKGQAVAEAMKQEIPGADLRVQQLDLASLSSVETFARQITSAYTAIDILINNAGIMHPPSLLKTEDGFELQLGSNYLGHYALTGRLFDLLEKGHQPRVVTMSSIQHKSGHINFEDLMSENEYQPRRAYAQSKLANAIFGLELDRRLRAANSPLISVLAHPGISYTNLMVVGYAGFFGSILKGLNAATAQPVERGVLPQLYAATAPGVQGGQFFGPDGFMEIRGNVTEVQAAPEAHNPVIARRLWDISEQLTGVALLALDKISPGKTEG